MAYIIGCGCVFDFEYANTAHISFEINCGDVVFFLHPQEAETGFVPSVQDFDKKLAEADAYLQILIDQLKVGLNGATPNRHHHFIWNIVFIFTCLSH